MSDESACQLFHRCMTRRAGDDWREFLRCYGDDVERVIHQTLCELGARLPATEREELAQELYCRLLTNGDRRRGFDGRGEQELWAYLGQLARNLVIDSWRRTGAGKRRASLEDGGDPDAAGDPVLIPGFPGMNVPGASPEERILAQERRRLFIARCRQVARSAVARLQRGARLRILRLALLEGWTSREIADRFAGAVTPAQVDHLVHRLRRHLAKEGIEVPRRTSGAAQLTGGSAAAAC